MYRAFYENLTFTWVPLTATLFFVAVFLAVLVRVLVLSKARDFDPVAQLPLFDEEKRS